MSDNVERLKRLPLFAQLDPASLQALANHLSVHDFADGEAIFSEREPGESLHVLDEGTVVVSKVIDWDDMREKTLAILPKGAFFGEGSLMDNVPRSATVRARGSARTFQLTRQAFMDLVGQSPLSAAKLLFAMTKIVNARLRQTSAELVTLYDTGKIAGAGHSLDRLVEEILERISESTGSAKAGLFLMNPYTLQLELAGCVGLVPPTGPLDPAAGIFGAVLGERRTILTRAFSKEGIEALGFEPEVLLAVPMVLGDEATGMLLLGDREGGLPYNVGHLHLLQGVAAQVANAVVNAFKKAEEDAAEAHNRHYVTF